MSFTTSTVRARIDEDCVPLFSAASSLFGDDDDDEDEIFGGKKVKPSSSIDDSVFGEDDEDEKPAVPKEAPKAKEDKPGVYASLSSLCTARALCKRAQQHF